MSLIQLLSKLRTRNGGNKFVPYWEMLYRQVSNLEGQKNIFGETLDDWHNVYIVLTVLLTLCVVGIRLLWHRLGVPEEKVHNKYLVQCGLYVVGGYLCTLPIISSMQVQHFTIAYFGMFLLIMLELCYITSCIQINWKAIMLALGIFAVCTNIYNDRIFINKLVQTEGWWNYNVALNQFAQEAYQDEERDKKIYVFPQWGFMANFIYLTSNQCKVVRDADIDPAKLQQQMDTGYTIVIAAMDETYIDEVIDELEFDGRDVRTWYSKEGNLIFTSVSLEASGNE